MNNDKLIMEMTKYFSGQPQRVQHFMKVYAYSSLIGRAEKLSKENQEILETAAIVHDIGIKPSEEKYGDSIGKHQEELGPQCAREMLQKLSYSQDVIERVEYLVGHHHTYSDIDGLDYQILVEADFLVNILEDDIPQKSIPEIINRIFKTETGITLCKEMFNVR